MIRLARRRLRGGRIRPPQD